MSHAILSPSKAARWLACPPSARLEHSYPSLPGAAAMEGTLAHKLAELEISYKLGIIPVADYAQKLVKLQNEDLYNADMSDHVSKYVDFVLYKYKAAKRQTKDTIIALEQFLDLSHYVPEGYGTCDALIIADGLLEVIDLKYGRGIKVQAKDNKQMMLYALGAFLEFGYLYDIYNIRMNIYQPRMDNFSNHIIAAKDLLSWATRDLKPKAQLAYQGLGEYSVGDHCQFCKARPSCRSHANSQLSLAKYEFRDAKKLSDKQIARILCQADSFRSWLKALEEYALEQVVNNAKSFPGLKLVRAKSKRKYKNEKEVAKRLLQEGYKEEDIYSKALLPITAMEKTISKSVFNKLLGDLVSKSDANKVLLVPLSDHRAMLNTTTSAKEDFKK